MEFRINTKNERLIAHYCLVLHVSQDELLDRLLSLLNGREVDVISVLRQDTQLRFINSPHFTENMP